MREYEIKRMAKNMKPGKRMISCNCVKQIQKEHHEKLTKIWYTISGNE